MRRRDQFHKKARKFNRPSDWSECRRLRNLINSSLRQAKKTYFAEKLEESRPNPSEFWKTLKHVLPNKNVNCDIDRLIVDDKEVTGHKDIADAINSYLTSIASSLFANSNEMESEFAPDEAPLNIKPFKFTIRNVNEVSKAIEDLNQAKATGPDGIPVRALKMAAPNISRSLTHLFNESLSTGKFPSAWKTAKVTPPFKGGTATDCNNYRPISVLPCISKILKSFANSDLQNFAFNSGLIDHHQFAYSKFSSTTVALLKVVDSWKRAIDNGFKSVSVFLDLRKAFVIKHEVLLTRLESYGVTESELRWFNSYLSERLQYVVYKGITPIPCAFVLAFLRDQF